MTEAGLIERPVPTRVARVAVDVPLAHLDRLFDYSIPDTLAEAVLPGVRVRVRFSGRLLDGWVVSVGAADQAKFKSLRRCFELITMYAPP